VSFNQDVSDTVKVVEATGVAILVVGGLAALIQFVASTLTPDRRAGSYQQLRQNLGRVILLGLEVLIVADIVRTVIVEPTLTSVTVLAAIVIIRIVLSWSLELEIDGTWPWDRWQRMQEASSAEGTSAGDPGGR